MRGPRGSGLEDARSGEVLQTGGYQVERMEDAKCDATQVLGDLRMPGRGGWEGARWGEQRMPGVRDPRGTGDSGMPGPRVAEDRKS